METLNFIIKLAKAAIIVSIAIFFVRCSLGSFVPDVNIDGIQDGDSFRVEVIENGNSETVIIKKNDEEILVVEGGEVQ
jgi:hypothetical protein